MSPAVIGLLGVLLGGGFIGGVATFRKAGAESSSVAAQTLIAVNEELRRELGRRAEELERRDREIAELRERLVAVESRMG